MLFAKLVIRRDVRSRIIHTAATHARQDDAECSFVLDVECAGAVSEAGGFFQEAKGKAPVRGPDFRRLILDAVGACGDLFGRGVAQPTTGVGEITHESKARFDVRTVPWNVPRNGCTDSASRAANPGRFLRSFMI